MKPKWLFVAAVLLALSLVSVQGVAQAQPAPVDPSFQLVRGVPDTCSAAANEEIRFDTLNYITFGSGSNRAVLSVESVGQVAVFEGNHNLADDYPSIGDGFYDVVVGQPYDVPAGTPITVEITTYTGLNQSGEFAYYSTLTYNCETGETIALDNQNLLGDINAQPPALLDLPGVNPAFELVQGVPDTCSAAVNEEIRFDTFNNVGFGSGSNRATLSVDGVGQVALFEGNHDQPGDYPSIGDGFYDFVIDQGYDAPNGTTITAEITTYTGLNQTGQLAYRSTLTYECNLGDVIAINNANLLADGTVQPDTVAGIPDVDPAFALTDGAANTCSVSTGDFIRFDSLNNVTFGSGSNRATLSVDGVGQVALYEGNHDQPDVYPSIGSGFFDVGVDNGYSVPAGTAITVEITTFSGLNQSGQPVYRSTLTYSCDTGAVVTVDNAVQ